MQQQHLRSQIKSPTHKKKVANTNINHSQSQIDNLFKLNCQKHQEHFAEKLCINPNCEHKEVVFCSECLIENQTHVGLHRETVISYTEFIDYCKTMSIKFKDELGRDLSQKQFTALLLDLNKQTDKFKQYIKTEEEKLDTDFDSLITQFVKDITDIKDKIKFQLNTPLNKFIEISSTLQQKAKDLNAQRPSNYQYNNDFDEFLQNVQSIQQKPYNMKKLLTNLSPFITKQNNLLSQTKSFINNNVLQEQNQNFDNVSQASGVSFCSNFTLNLSSMPYLAPLKDIYSEFKELINNKPFYRNKGVANSVFRNIFTDSRKLYYQLLDVLNEFVVYPNSRQHLQTNSCNNNQQFQTNASNISINNNQVSVSQQIQSQKGSFQQCPQTYNNNNGARNCLTLETFEDQTEKLDYIDLKQSQKLKEIDFIKSIESTHKGGIFCIKVLDDETFVTGSKDKSLKVWNILQNNQFEEKKTIQFKNEITSLGVLPRKDGSQLVVCGLYKCFAVLNQNYDILKLIETDHDYQINQMICLKDGETVITTSSDPKIVCWNVFQDDFRPKKHFEHRDVIYALELFPSKNYFASAGRDRTIKIWRLVFFKDFKNSCLDKIQLDLNIQDAHNSDITALKASQEYPELLFSGASNGEIKIWEVNDGICLKAFKNYSGWVYKLILFERPSTTNPYLVKSYVQKEEIEQTGNQENVQKFHSGKKNIKKNTRQHNFSITGNIQNTNIIQNSNTNQKINEVLKDISFFSASFDGTIKIWEANQATPVFETKSKNYHDCYPFGGVTAFKTENSEKIQLFMTGNKNDSTINLWSFK